MTISRVHVEDDLLEINESTVRFANSIGDVVRFDEFVVIRLKLTGVKFPDIHRNVYAINCDGSIRWQIEECPDLVGGKHSAYGGLYEVDGGLWATTTIGISYKLDPDTGEILEKKIVK